MLYQGKQLQLTRIDKPYVHLIFDGVGSVNVLSDEACQELAVVLDILESDTSIKGLLISSAKAGFIAGADINEFAPIFHGGETAVRQLLDRINRSFNRLESLPFPTVVAISGFALGGGCELSLACDYRIGDETTKIGLPETRLGIVPGWGGTVRLPRIAGIETAVEWIATGKEQRAPQAFKAGVLDAVTTNDQLIEVAKKTLERCALGQLDYLNRRRQKQAPLKHNDVELTMAMTTSKAFVAAQAGHHYPAPIAAVKTLEKAAKCTRDQALKFETDTFVKLTQTSQAIALSGIFINDQWLAKKSQQWIGLGSKEVARAAVLGAGIMGGGIAYQSASKGVPIKMKDIAQTGLDLGLSEANKLLVKQVERGRLTASAMGEVLNRIEPVLSYEGFEQVDIVVEAVVENPKVKAKVLSELEGHVSEDTIITSNTSTISIDHLAKSLKRPENFCGLHFFNPVHAMPLVEVIRGEKTTDTTIATTLAYAKAIGKKAVVVNDCAGFLVNRVLFPYLAGFSLLLRDGAHYEQIDKVMERWGWPMGPAYLMDVIGIDTCIHAEQVVSDAYPERMGRDYASAAEWLFEREHFGQKTQQGFYRYQTNKKGKLEKISDAEHTAKIIAASASKSKVFSDDEILMRMMVPMVNELCHCLDEGIVDSVAEADMALVYGLGFPPFRGGVFRWLDAMGLAQFCEQAQSFEALGDMYRMTKSLQAKRQAGALYYPIPQSAINSDAKNAGEPS